MIKTRRNNLILICFIIFNFIFASVPLEIRAAGASLYLSPSTGTYAIGRNFSVAIKVNTGGEVVNAAEGTISFDANLLSVVSVSKSGSIFLFWTKEPSFNNSAGTISFGGGLPPPAYNGTAGHIITVTFKAKRAGTAAVRFTSGATLANDGKGTNILASMGSGSYTVAPQVVISNVPSSAKEPKKVESEYNKPIIKSLTHPDQDKWYNKNTVKFLWELPKSVSGISLAFNDSPISNPGPVSDGLFSDKEYTDIEDGIKYLHLKYKDNQRWGTIAHFKVMIDTVAPESFKIEVKEGEMGEWPELIFETIDKGSGMEKYEIFIDGLNSPAYERKAEDTTLKVSGLNTGEHTALIKAIDKAGNERIASVNFFINSIEAPKIIDYPKELRSSDKFFIRGSSVKDGNISIYIEQGNKLIYTASATSSDNGSWFYIHDISLDNGRYVAWAKAVNKNGISSKPSEKISFLVSPPVFATIGTFVINYFTVFVSLLFMIILIVMMIFYLIGFLRKRLKKETVEVEEVLHRNTGELKIVVENEFKNLSKYEGKANYKSEKTKMKSHLKKKIDEAEKNILKELKDVERILK